MAKSWHSDFSEANGFAKYIIKLMAQLYREHPSSLISEAIGQQAVAQLPSIEQIERELGGEEVTYTFTHQISP